MMVLRLLGTIMLLLPLGPLVGCGEAPITPEDHRNLALAVKSYDSGDDARVIQNANAVLMKHTSGDVAMKAYYLRGMANFRSANNTAAVNDLGIVVRNASNDQLALRAKDALGELAFRSGDLDTAKLYFTDVVEGIPQAQRPSDHARFRLGCVLQRQGNWAQADRYFQRVIYLFPKSKLADEAKKRVNSRKWTIQAGHYRKSENAGELASKLRKAGFDAVTKPESQNEKLVFSVLVGRWDNYDSAERKLPAVKKVKTDAFLRVTR